MLMADRFLWSVAENILDNLNDSKNKRQTLHDMLAPIIETAELRGAVNSLKLSVKELGLADMSEPEFVVNMIDEIMNPSNPSNSKDAGERFESAVAFMVKAKFIWTYKDKFDA